MSKDKNLISEYQETYQGEKVTVKKFKTKEKRTNFNGRRNITNCPNCLSSVLVDGLGIWSCSGDRIKIWEKDFAIYYKLDNSKKVKYLTNLTSDSQFLELYDRWVYATENSKPEEFTCGYTNKIFFPVGSTKTTMFDPVYTKLIENKLNRKLTEPELLGEEELWIYQNKVIKKFKKGAKKVRIPIIYFPGDV